MSTGKDILRLARQHFGEEYRLGAIAPKDNHQWKGPWDCAEFASWLTYQGGGFLYGCENNNGDPAKADAYTGYWHRDARRLGKIISIEEAARIPGAAVLRVPAAEAIGHIVVSDGNGGTVEAHSTKRGVIASTLSGRRWDLAILVPGIQYEAYKTPIVVKPPAGAVFRLKKPPMRDPLIRRMQFRLKKEGFHPGPIDGEYGPLTQAALLAFQLSRGLVADGEAGPATMRALQAVSHESSFCKEGSCTYGTTINWTLMASTARKSH